MAKCLLSPGEPQDGRGALIKENQIMQMRMSVALPVFSVVILSAGFAWWTRRPESDAHIAAKPFGSQVTESTNTLLGSVVWESAAPPVPRNASELDNYLDAVLLRTQRYPETGDDALELALNEIAKLEPADDLGVAIEKQRSFAARMRQIAASRTVMSPTLPDAIAAMLDEIRRTPELGARQGLVTKYLQRLGDLPGPTQVEAIDALRTAVTDY